MNLQPADSPSEDPNRLLTEPDVCRLLRIKPRQLFNWRRAGLIPYLKIGKAVRFRPSALNQALAQLEVNATRRPRSA